MSNTFAPKLFKGMFILEIFVLASNTSPLAAHCCRRAVIQAKDADE